MGADAVLAVVEDRAEPKCPLQVPPAALDLRELLVAEAEVGGREAVVVGSEHELAVVACLGCDGGLVDAQLALSGSPEQAVEAGRGAQLADELVATLLGPLVGALDLSFQVGDEVGSHG